MSVREPLAGRPFPPGRDLVLHNQLFGTAHATGLVSDGLALPGDAEYWRRRAAGGAAMLVVGGTVTALESTWRRRIVTEAWREEAMPGMAARADAIRGDGAVALAGGGAPEVVVFDQREAIGGQLAVAAAPNRAGWQALLDFYRASLEAAGGVTLRLGTTADLADFGEVILAVGTAGLRSRT